MCKFLIVAVAFGFLLGCAGQEVAPDERENVISAVSVGDEVEISKSDGTYAAFTVKAIEDRELIGESVRVSIADIETITVHVKDDPNSISDRLDEDGNWDDRVRDGMMALQYIIYAIAVLASL